MRTPDVIAIPESANADHVRANRDAPSVALDLAAIEAIDAAFPPPTHAAPLAVI
jgi:diketogulonate reductase-like aldo/keto reductase